MPWARREQRRVADGAVPDDRQLYLPRISLCDDDRNRQPVRRHHLRRWGEYQRAVHGDAWRQRGRRERHRGARRVPRIRVASARRLRGGPHRPLLADYLRRLRHQPLRSARHGACRKLASRGRPCPGERIGRALRKPTVEAMLSYTTAELGKGWVYALNTALDEIGATLGPLLIALVLLLKGDYRTGYALLVISAAAALVGLVVARVNFPLPSRLERGQTAPAKNFSKAYWMYMLAGALFAAGLMSFELISYHLSVSGIVAGPWIPIFLAVSTAFGVL